MSEASAFLEAESIVRKGGVEPPKPFGYRILSPARLPVPPLSRDTDIPDSMLPPESTDQPFHGPLL